MGVYIPNGRLPSAYQEVEYIQSTATSPGTTSSSGQYIDTGFTPTQNTKIEIDIKFNVTTVQQRLFGIQTENSSYMTFDAYINGSTQWARAMINGSGNWITTSVSADTNRHTFVLDKNGYTIYTNGTQIYSAGNQATPTKSCNHSLPLLARWLSVESGTTYNKICQHSSATLYGCKIRDNSILVREFVPCYRKSDTVIGLYDLVNSVFYTNSGTGTFSKGNDVAMPELRNVYLGESGYTPYSITFSYTGSDQSWTVPYTQSYRITAKGAGGKSAKGGLGSGIFELTAGDTFSVMVGANGGNGNGTKYGFGGSANGGGNAAGGGLSGVFTGSGAIAATDSARALVIGGGAGGNGAGTGGVGGGATGGTGTGSYGTAGGGGTQTDHGSGGNAGANQFNGGNGSGTYGYGGGGGRWGGRGSQGDGSGDDDKGGGGGSGYVKSIATGAVLTQGGGANAGSNGEVIIEAVEV